MGMMEHSAADGRLIVTPHPVTLEGQTNVPAALRPGESLYAFLQRHVDGLDGQAWQVSIGGVPVPREHWHHVRPKDGQVIEVRAAVGRSALMLIATVALAYFTFGAGSLFIGAGAAIGGGVVAAAAVYVAGSIIINKVLGPKPAKAGAGDADSVYSLRGARNRARPYQPLGLLFGSVRIAPDLVSNPYTWYAGDDQYLGMVLTPGINVDSVGALYNGEALLSSFEGVQVWHNGFPGMASQAIPLHSNADTLAGGSLDAESQHTPGPWVQRTGSPDTIRLQVDVEYLLFDTSSKGKPQDNSETIQIQYRAVGSGTWQAWGNYSVTSRTQRTRRVSYTRDVALGQYDVRVRIAGNNTAGSGATARFTWSTLTSVQRDEASYAGIPRIGIQMRATGQLSGAPDELRCVAHAAPAPVWKGASWVTEATSNPGAQILQYARGIDDSGGRRIAGLGLPDSQIDIPALQAFMLHCAAEGYTYDHWITEPRSHEEMLNAIALAGFGHITWAGGKLSVVWAADDQPLSGVVNMATIKRAAFQVDYTLANAADGIEYTYFDRTDWTAKTLRVAAPGVTTMLTPAQVQGEGITGEAHAARMARWHLAQSLYQYKDIRYSTDLEHLSYRRMSVLALQHDLTQWGYGGRLGAAVNAAGVVTLTLDEDVPAPASGNAYVGLRIPGERVYRVFQVQPFAGSSRTLTLVEEWPDDAALPGSSESNPAWDTIWIYDFKQTPGYRVRVVGIEPEDDLKGAAVSVVPEGPEFWDYVLTGNYVPPNNPSLLQTRPVASNLRVTEARIVQGNTVFIELTAVFEVSGPVGVTVFACAIGDEPLAEVAQTLTRTAVWRIPEEGAYSIVARPYAPDGTAGVPAVLAHTTAGAAVPAFDGFSVTDMGAGVRRYQWGYLASTIQPANLAGAEIRYVAGTVAGPDWEAMTAVGEGVHTAGFEAVIPAAGTWTFAARARNTDGLLSDAFVTTVTLSDSLPQVIGGIDQALVDQQTALAAEALARFNADAAEAAARVSAINAEATARTAGLLAEATARGAAITAEQTARQEADESLAENILTLTTASGANAAAISAEATARANADSALASDISTVAGVAAGNTAAISAEATARANADSALASDISAVNVALGGKASASAVLALEGRVDEADDGIASNSSALLAVKAVIGGGGNLLRNSDFSASAAGWQIGYVYGGGWGLGRDLIYDARTPPGAHALVLMNGGAATGLYAAAVSDWLPAKEGDAFIASAYLAMATMEAWVTVQFLNADGSVQTGAFDSGHITTPHGGDLAAGYARAHVRGVAPSGTRLVRMLVWGVGTANGPALWIVRPQLEVAGIDQTLPSPWAPGANGTADVSVTQALSADAAAQKARHAVYLDVNGYIAGTETTNDGVTAEANFLADVFRVMKPGGGARLEWSDGNQRTYDASGTLRVRIGVW